MVIPWVRISWISDEKGYGLLADRDIPKGTVTFAQDGLDIVLSEKQLESIDNSLLEYVEKYSYEDFMGNRIISWDFGKYMNHDDNANTLSTGYGFEVAIRDIKKGEEVTDDYRIFSTHHDTSFKSPPHALEDIRPWPEKLINKWDKDILSALLNYNLVTQPLEGFIPEMTLKQIRQLRVEEYQSVARALPLRYKLQTQNSLL